MMGSGREKLDLRQKNVSPLDRGRKRSGISPGIILDIRPFVKLFLCVMKSTLANGEIPKPPVHPQQSYAMEQMKGKQNRNTLNPWLNAHPSCPGTQPNPTSAQDCQGPFKNQPQISLIEFMRPRGKPYLDRWFCSSWQGVSETLSSSYNSGNAVVE